jgi:hypothetical protein
MSNPKYTKYAKRRWKTMKKTIERFYRENGRQMNYEEAKKAFNKR